MPTTFSDEVYDEDRMRSCIYGLAVGDALGVPYEFRERGTFECTNMVGGGTHGQYAGTWSDDTSMALCICSSIKQCDRVVVADIAYRFHRWLELGDFTCDGRVFDVGATCKRAISRTRCVPTRAISVRSAPNASSTQGIALSICVKTSCPVSIS